MSWPFLRKLCTSALVTLTLALVAFDVGAQAWPTQPVKLIVFGPAGASADFTARILATELEPIIGQPVIVENKPGGAAAPAVSELRSGPRDGHKIMLSLNGLVTELPFAFKLSYNPTTDLAPLAQVAKLDLILVGNNNVPAKDLKELVALVKAHPNTFNYGSYSPGTLSHIMGLQLNSAAGLDMTHIGYKGGTFNMSAVMAGDIQLAFDVIANAVQFVKSGKMRAFAVSGTTRSPLLPDVPTFRESGFPQLEESISFIVWTPPEVPVAIQAKIRAAVLKAMDKQSVRDKLAVQAIQPGTDLTPDALRAEMKKESEVNERVLRSIGFKAE